MVQARSEAFGPSHFSTLRLKDILISKGQFQDAIDRGRQVVHDCIRELGHEHSSCQAAKRSLAKALVLVGETSEALQITEEFVRGQENAATEQSPSPRLVDDFSFLGMLYFQAGDRANALGCYQKIQKWISLDKGNATYAANSVNNFAAGLAGRGHAVEAKRIFEALLEECSKVLGPDSEEASLAMGNLSHAFSQLGEWDKVESLGRQVVEIRRRVLGPSHPNTITALGNLRAAMLARGNITEAVELAKNEVQCVKNAVHATDESTVSALLTISTGFESARAFEEAISFLEEVTSLRDAGGDTPQFGNLSAFLLQAICHLRLSRIGVARNMIFHLLVGFLSPFKENLNDFLPGLLRLLELCREHELGLEAEQVLVGAALLSGQGSVVKETKEKVKVEVSRYLRERGSGSAELEFNPFSINGSSSKPEK